MTTTTPDKKMPRPRERGRGEGRAQESGGTIAGLSAAIGVDRGMSARYCAEEASGRISGSLFCGIRHIKRFRIALSKILDPGARYAAASPLRDRLRRYATHARDRASPTKGIDNFDWAHVIHDAL